MRRRSRLSRSIEDQSRKNIIISILGIVLIIVVLAKFGLPLFTTFTSFLIGAKNSSEQKNQNDTPLFVSPPILDLVKSATNSAKITVSGTASDNQIITLYVNGDLIDKTKVGKNNTFSFKDVELKKGENKIKAKATVDTNNLADKNKKESGFSNEEIITYKSGEPSLSIDSPSENQSFSKEENAINVNGKTDVGNRVTVNDFWAIVDENGNYSYRLSLQNGDNNIKVIATDEAGNQKTMERKVTYSP